MAPTAVVFQVCRAATATTMGASAMSAPAASGGVPRPPPSTPGAAKSIPATSTSIGPTATYRAGFLFVAFGIERVGGWSIWQFVEVVWKNWTRNGGLNLLKRVQLNPTTSP